MFHFLYKTRDEENNLTNMQCMAFYDECKIEKIFHRYVMFITILTESLGIDVF